jgi:hypothetical protein
MKEMKDWDLKGSAMKVKNYVQGHAKEIVLSGLGVIGVVVGVAVIAKLDQSSKDEDRDSYDRVEDALPSEDEFPGYDIWAMMNGNDSKVVEFAPKLEEFCNENDITINCDIIE